MLSSNDRIKEKNLAIITKIGYAAWMSPIFILKYSLMVIVTLPAFLILQFIFIFNDKSILQTHQTTAFQYVATHLDLIIANSIGLAVFSSLLILLFPWFEKKAKKLYIHFFTPL